MTSENIYGESNKSNAKITFDGISSEAGCKEEAMIMQSQSMSIDIMGGLAMKA